MAEAWRKISTADKEKYNAVANDIEGSNEEEDEEELTPEKKRQLIVRVAKRHQGDVGVVSTICARIDGTYNIVFYHLKLIIFVNIIIMMLRQVQFMRAKEIITFTMRRAYK